MAHSGKESEMPKELREQFSRLFDADRAGGLLKAQEDEFRAMNANNAWPNGMMREDDEGVCAIAVGAENGNVVIQFSEPQKWVGMTPEQAVDLAQLIIARARQVAKKPLTVTLG